MFWHRFGLITSKSGLEHHTPGVLRTAFLEDAQKALWAVATRVTSNSRDSALQLTPGPVPIWKLFGGGN